MHQRVLALCAAMLCTVTSALPQIARAEPVMLPDGRNVLPPPPVAGSHALAADMQAFENTRALRGSQRWQLAHNDANLKPQHIIRDFSCAAGFMLIPEQIPALLSLLDALAKPLEQRVTEEKNFWRRPRPFVGTTQDICTPETRAKLTDSFAYPSGHTTWGWMTASILASALPERASQIMQRGRIFGESRIACGVHWKSDVQAGYMNGSIMFAALQEQPWFAQKMTEVRTQLQLLQSHPTPPDATTCAQEHEAATNTF